MVQADNRPRPYFPQHKAKSVASARKDRRPSSFGMGSRQNVFNTLEKKRQRKDQEAHLKAGALRKYSKLCARENIQSERVNVGKRPDKNERKKDDKDKEGKGKGNKGNKGSGEGSSEEGGKGDEEKETEKKVKGKGKGKGSDRNVSVPFKKALTQAEQKRDERLQAQADRQARELEKSKKEKERAVKKKQMLAKTAKGQPLMKNKIMNLLEKIKKTKELDIL